MSDRSKELLDKVSRLANLLEDINLILEDAKSTILIPIGVIISLIGFTILYIVESLESSSFVLITPYSSFLIIGVLPGLALGMALFYFKHRSNVKRKKVHSFTSVSEALQFLEGTDWSELRKRIFLGRLLLAIGVVLFVILAWLVITGVLSVIILLLGIGFPFLTTFTIPVAGALSAILTGYIAWYTWKNIILGSLILGDLLWDLRWLEIEFQERGPQA
ncbi:hypothetical protein L3N51_01223 [Metallosphaera sp. J1]|uniref:hypothetical protein n=1 Tax=Metallosphaera javensis (ex Hofmann et al. 2022) TaxID=99938 RepID=UPI001EDF6548|nr:hypothetical protein [Metallosphaera javensis (ex Hofmann et al. 2022)]MCG3108933.1 hypothetical protein [Metallosphaera javensis (ex Hofmann et al. 2022)]